MTSDLCYSPSGHYSLPGAALGLALGLGAAVILGPIYGGFTSWLPIAGVVTFLLAVLFGGAIGGVAAQGLKWGHVRNGAVAAGVGALAGSAGLYLAWAAWIWGLLESNHQTVSYASLLLHPQRLGGAILKINETGAWSIGGISPSGVTLWFLWALEAILAIGPAAFLPVSIVTEPYCERCHAWCVTNKGVAIRRTARADESERLREKDLALLQAMGAPEANAFDYMRLDLTNCPKCGQMHTLSARNVRVRVDAKGKQSEREAAVVNHLLLNEQEADAVRALAAVRESAA
jgi:hypothetical protein